MNKLTTTLINLKRKFASRIGKDRQSRRKKKREKKGEKIKGGTLTTEDVLVSRKTHLQRAGWRSV